MKATEMSRMFNMATDEGKAACREYRRNLEARGFVTWLEYFTGDNFVVKSASSWDKYSAENF